MSDLVAQVRELLAKASSLPWKIVTPDHGIGYYDPQGEDYVIVANFYQDGIRRDGAKTNTHLTLLAVNALEPLVVALEAVLGEADSNWDDWTETDDQLLGDTPVGQGRKALADLQEQLQEAARGAGV